MTTAADQLTRTNPLVNFRKPDNLARKTGETHFFTQRDDVPNDQGISSIYPGEFTYTKDAALEIELALWEDNDDPKMLALYYKMTGRDGYQPAKFDEWRVADRLMEAWKGDDAGRITLGGRSKNTLVLMWRTGESYDKAFNERLRFSNDVQKSAEEKQAELSDKLAPLGARVSVSVTDEDDDSDDLPAQPKKRRR